MFFIDTIDLLRISPSLGSLTRGYIERPAVTLYDKACTLDDIKNCEAAMATTTDPVSLAYLSSELADMNEELSLVG